MKNSQPNFKPYLQEEERTLRINLKEQLLPETFEYTISFIIENYINLKVFYHRYKNHEHGAKAYHPAMLLKIILYAYSKGLYSSRKIEEACRNNIIFKALSAAMEPDHSTIAHFISSMEKEVLSIFVDVLFICAQLDLIGGEVFALDGCKISSNASKEWSGTFEELERKKERLKQTVQLLIDKHKKQDKTNKKQGKNSFNKKINDYHRKIRNIESFLSSNTPKEGKRGEVKSNVTDNESAKMPSSHGVIQGYNGMSLVDGKHQIIFAASAFGSVDEGEYLQELIVQAKDNACRIGYGSSYLQNKILLADTAYYSENNLSYLPQEKIDAYIPDSNFRSRDPRFPEINKYRKNRNLFKEEDFVFDSTRNVYICPAGKILKYDGYYNYHGYKGPVYMADVKDCEKCPFNRKCFKTNAKRKALQIKKELPQEKACLVKMKEKIDSESARDAYSKRMGIVEPVFANVTETKGLDYFTLRGKAKVNIQWSLYSLVHNLEKIKNYAFDKLMELKNKLKRNGKNDK